MKKVENQATNKYVESKTIRNETLDNVDYDFLDKIKAIPYLTNDTVVTIDQVASYYEVTREAIKTIVKRNRYEFETDGMIVLKGKELQQFKKDVCWVQNEPDISRTPSLTILTKRSLLRVGMLLTNSEIATTVRNYLLNIEEKTGESKRIWSAKREAAKLDRVRMTSAISKYIPDSPHKSFAYPNYTNMVYRVIFGKDAKTLREERKVLDNDLLRDSFSEDELGKVEEVETIITGLISMEFTYEQIKNMIQERYVKKVSMS